MMLSGPNCCNLWNRTGQSARTATAGPLLAISWPLRSWAACITSTRALADGIDGRTRRGVIVRGDRHPAARASGTKPTIGLTNLEEQARSPPYLWRIGLAAGPQKEVRERPGHDLVRLNRGERRGSHGPPAGCGGETPSACVHLSACTPNRPGTSPETGPGRAQTGPRLGPHMGPGQAPHRSRGRRPPVFPDRPKRRPGALFTVLLWTRKSGNC